MNFCRLFYRWVLIVVVAAAMSACGGGGDTGGAGDPGGGGLPASTTKISGTVTLSSIAKSTKGYRGAIMMATSPLNLATVQLYNADKPEWLYPVAETATDSSGNYTLEKLANASNNSGAYTDNDPIPTGNYTIIAYKYSPITLLMSVAVQEYVKKFDGVITGHDLTAYDSSQVPAVVSMFGIVDKNTDGSFGSPSWPLPQNAAIQITFNMAMARSSVLNSVNIKDGLNNSVQGIWKVAPDLLSAVFYPTASLALDTVYTVTVLNTVKNVYGKEITATVTGQFISVASDTTPPNVALAEPAAQTDVPVNTSIILAANEALDINTFSITSTPSIGDKPAVIFAGKGNVVGKPYMYNIIPNGPLQLNTDYSVTFSGAKDLAGNAMTAATFNFKTTAVADTTPPVTTASPPAGAYTSAQTVTLTANETATIYYTTDGITAPTTSSTVYTSPIVINSTTILKFFAKDVAGNSETLQSLTYTISTLDTTPPTTVASPTGGKYTGTQTVALTANEPATIYYTTNGTDPTTSSTVYTAPISIAATTTLKFYAVDTAGNSEAIIAIKTEVYTIGTQATTGIWETSNWDGALWGP